MYGIQIKHCMLISWIDLALHSTSIDNSGMVSHMQDATISKNRIQYIYRMLIMQRYLDSLGQIQFNISFKRDIPDNRLFFSCIFQKNCLSAVFMTSQDPTKPTKTLKGSWRPDKVQGRPKRDKEPQVKCHNQLFVFCCLPTPLGNIRSVARVRSANWSTEDLFGTKDKQRTCLALNL